MVRLLFFALLFFIPSINSCQNGSYEWQNGCYTFISNATGFMDAEFQCIQKGGHLTSIHDGFTNAWISQEAFKHFQESKEFWIGFSNLINPGNWSWTDGTPMDFNDTLVNSNATDSDCTFVSTANGRWHANICSEAKPYVCKSAKPGYPAFENCPTPFLYFQPTHSCYGDPSERRFKNWTLSEEYCISAGGHLASIHSKAEIVFLRSLIFFTATNFWVGASSNDGGHTWKWSDNTPWDFNPWAAGYPDQSKSFCGTGFGDGLVNKNCSDSRTLVCQIKL